MDDISTISSQPARTEQGITWLSFLYCLIVPLILILLRHAGPIDRPILPKGSPALWSAHHWPIIGSALQFYRRRRDMVVAGTHAVPSGTFSFFIGRKHIVNLGGIVGRQTFFENKEFSVSQGHVCIFSRASTSSPRFSALLTLHPITGLSSCSLA